MRRKAWGLWLVFGGMERCEYWISSCAGTPNRRNLVSAVSLLRFELDQTCL